MSRVLLPGIVAAASLACSAPDLATARNAADGRAPRRADGQGPPSSPVPTAATGAATTLHSDMAVSYFAGGPAAEAALLFARREWRGARDGFARALAGTGQAAARSEQERARLRFLVAVADAHLEQWPSAARGFEQATPHFPALADTIHFCAARAHYFAGDHQAAARHAALVSPASIRGAEAELLLGDVLRARGDWNRVAEHYRRYLEREKGAVRRDEARFRLAEALEQLGQAEPEALSLYREITVKAPLGSFAEPAASRLAALADTLPEDARARVATLRPEEYVERGMVYYRAMRNPLSAADFAAALATPGLTRRAACVAAYHRADSWFKERDRTKSAPLFDEAMELCRKAGHRDLLVRSAYQAGRSHSFLGQHQAAAARYAAAEKFAASARHSFADDARLRQAEEYHDLGDEEKVTELLSSLPALYPDGDMRAEAMWRLGWRAYQAGDDKSAIRWFEKQAQVMPVDHNWWAEGQAQYWAGRAHARLGDAAAAARLYRETVRLYPLSYYALLALNRLREEHPDRFAAVRREVGADRGGQGSAAASLRFKPRALYATPGFGRALEFIRLGLGGEAEAELGRLGLMPPPGKQPVTDPDVADKLWAMAYLHHRAGRYELSHWVTRWHLLEYKRSWPRGENRVRWEIAYPRPYWDLLARNARKHGYPTALQMAIVREESAFSPIRESYANAIGLTQMIFPTARRFAKRTGIEVTRENLRDPEKNVIIGSNFLGFLWRKWEGQIALVPPSYNAGEGATARWLRERGSWPTDAWIEAIPGDQARRYSKRVLASFFAYSYLADETIPSIPNTIPEHLVPNQHRVRAKSGTKPRDKSGRQASGRSRSFRFRRAR